MSDDTGNTTKDEAPAATGAGAADVRAVPLPLLNAVRLISRASAEHLVTVTESILAVEKSEPAQLAKVEAAFWLRAHEFRHFLPLALRLHEIVWRSTPGGRLAEVLANHREHGKKLDRLSKSLSLGQFILVWRAVFEPQSLWLPNDWRLGNDPLKQLSEHLDSIGLPGVVSSLGYGPGESHTAADTRALREMLRNGMVAAGSSFNFTCPGTFNRGRSASPQLR